MHRSRRTFAAVAALGLLLVSCASEPAADPVAPDEQAARSPAASRPRGAEDSPDRRGEKEGRQRRGRRADSPAGKRASGSEPRSGDAPGEGERAGGDVSSAPYPAAGTYLYDQEGYEEYCQAGSCDRRRLPDTQRVKASYSRRSRDAAVVVTDARVSDTRSVQTTTRYTRDAALIAKVVARFSFQAFSYENTYRPRPPVASLRFPLETGKSWSGSWRAQTSGDYSIAVTRSGSVTVAGRAVRAFRIETVTEFRGEFEGRARVTVWIDPATKAVVASDGSARLRSAFGDFATRFSTALRSAPSY